MNIKRGLSCSLLSLSIDNQIKWRQNYQLHRQDCIRICLSARIAKLKSGLIPGRLWKARLDAESA